MFETFYFNFSLDFRAVTTESNRNMTKKKNTIFNCNVSVKSTGQRFFVEMWIVIVFSYLFFSFVVRRVRMFGPDRLKWDSWKFCAFFMICFIFIAACYRELLASLRSITYSFVGHRRGSHRKTHNILQRATRSSTAVWTHPVYVYLVYV